MYVYWLSYSVSCLVRFALALRLDVVPVDEARGHHLQFARLGVEEMTARVYALHRVMSPATAAGVSCPVVQLPAAAAGHQQAGRSCIFVDSRACSHHYFELALRCESALTCAVKERALCALAGMRQATATTSLINSSFVRCQLGERFVVSWIVVGNLPWLRSTMPAVVTTSVGAAPVGPLPGPFPLLPQRCRPVAASGVPALAG